MTKTEKKPKIKMTRHSAGNYTASTPVGDFVVRQLDDLGLKYWYVIAPWDKEAHDWVDTYRDAKDAVLDMVVNVKLYNPKYTAE